MLAVGIDRRIWNFGKSEPSDQAFGSVLFPTRPVLCVQAMSRRVTGCLSDLLSLLIWIFLLVFPS